MLYLVLNKQGTSGVKVLPEIGLGYFGNCEVLPLGNMEVEIIENALSNGGRVRVESGFIERRIIL